jgi:hypothetical protein
MAAITFYAKVKDCKVYPADRRAWLTWLGQLDGKDITIKVGAASKAKSTQANRFYWGVVVAHVAAGLEVLQGTPFTTEEAHEVLKQYCNGEMINTRMGLLHMGRTTKGMSNEDFTAYIDRCIKWAAEYLGVAVPDSQEYFIEHQNQTK